jgi:hypothetical protein
MVREDIMQLVWNELWQKKNNWLKTGWLITAGLVALYAGAGQIHESRGISQGAGVAEVGWDPVSLRQAPLYDRIARMQSPAMMTYLPNAQRQAQPDGRKMVRTSSMDLVATNPVDSAERIRQMAERLGGFLVNSTANGAENARFATLTIRVPAGRFEEARAEIRKMGLKVESERVEAQDVTKEYVDMDARLRNLRVEETQYLTIMKRANTVKDTLEVSEKLSNVRGQIEQQQAEFDALSKQVETVAIAISLHSEAEAQVFGLHWRPLYQLKVAARDGLDGLAGYVADMAAFVFLFPTILLWLFTILVGAALGWRILRWACRVFFRWPQAAAVAGSGR